MNKPLPIGISDFKDIITGGYAYVDKTLFIQELLELGARVVLIPRMRRFGKTLNLSMLQYFFEKNHAKTSVLFKDLAIWKLEKYRNLQGQFPVVFISLKDIKFSSWENSFAGLRGVIAEEFRRHKYLLNEDVLDPEEKTLYSRIVREENDLSLTARSLRLLTEWLYRYHKQRVILLIDEYDTPAHIAYVNGYYDTMIEFLRIWLSAGLKDNKTLERGVLTGILRIAKESIFSGLNNVSTFTILHESFRDKFGFVEAEVEQLLQQSNLEHLLPQMRDWYDGYQIGSCKGVYNPWSVIKCIEEKGILASYWINTSDNALMKQLIAQGNDELKIDIENLLQDNTIEKTIEEGIVFPDLTKSSETVWSLFVYSGYLTPDGVSSGDSVCRLKIPNLEIGRLYRTLILNWFKSSIKESGYQMLLDSLANGDVTTFSHLFEDFMLSSASVFDVSSEEPEKIYHAFVLGMLIGFKDRYVIRSNRESGYGRYDVCLIPQNPNDLGIVMEFKKVDRREGTDLENAALAALQQIEEKQYDRDLLERGVQRILHLGLAFQGKRVLIRSRI